MRFVETGSYISQQGGSELIESESLKNDAGDDLRVDEAGPVEPALLEAKPHSTTDLLEKISGLTFVTDVSLGR